MQGQRFCHGCGRQKPLNSFVGNRCPDCRVVQHRRKRAQELQPHSLSPKQRAVADLMCLGKTNEEIGAILNRSPLTVKNHVQTIIHRLEANNRTRAAVIYTEKKLKEEL